MIDKIFLNKRYKPVDPKYKYVQIVSSDYSEEPEYTVKLFLGIAFYDSDEGLNFHPEVIVYNDNGTIRDGEHNFELECLYKD